MYTYNAEVVRILDGDTFEAMIDLGFGVFHRTKIRVLDYDAPETRRIRRGGTQVTEEEVTEGLDAKTAAEGLLMFQTVRIWSKRVDSFGRSLAQVWLPDGRDYVDVMRGLGFDRDGLVA